MKKHAWWTERRCIEHIASCNKNFDGSGTALVLDARGVITGDIEDARDPIQHAVYVPGDGLRFDAKAAARQLLAAWRDYQDGVRQQWRFGSDPKPLPGVQP